MHYKKKNYIYCNDYSSDIDNVEDVKNIEDIHRIICKLTNKVTYRLRKAEMKTSVVSVDLRTSDFRTYSHQKKLDKPTSSTRIILEQAKMLANEMFTGEAIRLIGVRVDKLTELLDKKGFYNELYISQFNND